MTRLEPGITTSATSAHHTDGGCVFVYNVSVSERSFSESVRDQGWKVIGYLAARYSRTRIPILDSESSLTTTGLL